MQPFQRRAFYILVLIVGLVWLLASANYSEISTTFTEMATRKYG